jgi:hypothetical protein
MYRRASGIRIQCRQRRNILCRCCRGHLLLPTPESFQSFSAAVGLQEDSIAVKIEKLLLSAREAPNIDGFFGVDAHTVE